MKNEKVSKFVLFLNQKTNYTFGRQIFLLISFDLKPTLKKTKSKFSNSFFDLKSKSEFQKIVSVLMLVLKLKNEKRKTLKIRFVFKSRNELYF